MRDELTGVRRVNAELTGVRRVNEDVTLPAQRAMSMMLCTI
jgi:hypothetical protein